LAYAAAHFLAAWYAGSGLPLKSGWHTAATTFATAQTALGEAGHRALQGGRNRRGSDASSTQPTCAFAAGNAGAPRGSGVHMLRYVIVQLAGTGRRAAPVPSLPDAGHPCGRMLRLKTAAAIQPLLLQGVHPA